MRTLDVLLAGFGGLGDQDHQTTMYGPKLAAHPGFRIVGVAATGPDDAERARAAAERFSVPYQDEPDVSTVDLVSVSAPADRRADVLERVLAAGRHVLADKPLARNVAEAERVAAAARRAGAVVVVTNHLRFHPMITAAAAALRQGRVGLPWNVQADFVVAGREPCPAGELINFGGYPVDVVAALTGLAVHRVYALAAGALTLLTLDHEHGLTSTIVVGRTGELAGVRPGGLTRHSYRVSGSHGVLLLDATKPAATVATATEAGREWLPVDTVTTLLDDLHAAITTGRPPAAGVEDALHTAAVLDAAAHSVAEGVPVPVKYPGNGGRVG